MAEYIVNAKDLTATITKCLGIISLGMKTESATITLDFSKQGLAIEVRNSMAAYRADLACKVNTPTDLRVSLQPELLIAYGKSYKELTLMPKPDLLGVKSGKFQAQIYYTGENEPVEVLDEEGEDISKIAEVARVILPIVSGIKNRTDKQELGVSLTWADGNFDLTVGDSHHAIVVDSQVKTKNHGSITMAFPNLQKIMDVGDTFSATESHFIAYSDTEYLMINNQSENMFFANTAREALQGKRTASVTVSTNELRGMIDVVTGPVSEESTVNFSFKADEIKVSVSTNASRASNRMAPIAFKGAETVLSVSVHHLRDCLSVMKEKETVINIFGNMLAFASATPTTTIKAGMALMASTGDN